MQAISSEEFSQRLHALLRQDRLALLIQLAEKWSQSQALPVSAALIEGEALLHLCQMDRAWTRFREVLEYDPENEEAMILVIELFLRRGWPTRARKMIPRLRGLNPRSPRIGRLESRAAAPPIGPPRNANQVIQTASPSQLVAIAERFLCSGSQLKGQQILELALRQDPQNMRARRLIWACQGDFSSIQKWNDLWEDALAEDVEDESIIEPTVNMVMDASEVRIDAFPALFRIEDEVVNEPDDGESTRRMAFPEDFPIDSETEETRGFDGDTQVLDIVSQKMSSDDPFESTGPAVQEIDVSVDNDDDVIVFTQIDESQIRPPPTPAPSGPIRVIEKRPKPDAALMERVKGPAKSEVVPPSQPEKPIEAKRPVSIAGKNEKIAKRPDRTNFMRLAAALGIIVLLVVIGSFGLNRSAKSRIDRLVTEAVLSTEYAQLHRIGLQLQAQANSGNPPVDTRQAYLGLVHAFLWRDFTHADSDLEMAQTVMSLDSSRTAVPWIPSAIDAIIASGEEDWESVGDILQEHDSELVNFLRYEAKIKLSGVIPDDIEQNPRTAILALSSSDSLENLPSWPKNFLTVEYRLLLLEKFWYKLSGEEKAKQLLAIKQYMQATEKTIEGKDVSDIETQEKLSAIQYYRFEFLRTLQDDKTAVKTRRSVYRLDVQNPIFQMWVGTDYLRQDQHEEAYPLFEKCARVYLDCLIGAVGVQITRDRLSDAHILVEQYSTFYSEEDLEALNDWILWAEGAEVKVTSEAPLWLFHWVGGTQPDEFVPEGLDKPVQSYLHDVLNESMAIKIETNAMMDSYLLWSAYQLKKSKSKSKLVLNALRNLSRRDVFSARQWGIIIHLYEQLSYSEQDKQEARQFYLQLKPNGKNAERLNP